jgi:phage-related protein
MGGVSIGWKEGVKFGWKSTDMGGTYRAVYTVKLAEAVFVLHCFQKKSKRGIATPMEDMDIIHARLKIAEAFAKELRK